MTTEEILEEASKTHSFAVGFHVGVLVQLAVDECSHEFLEEWQDWQMSFPELDDLVTLASKLLIAQGDWKVASDLVHSLSTLKDSYDSRFDKLDQ